MVCGRRGLWSRQKQRERRSLTKEGSSGSGVRGEPSGVEGQLWSLALVTSPSARASNEGNPSSSTGILSRVSVSTASKLASFSSSIFLESGKGKGREKEQREKIEQFSLEKSISASLCARMTTGGRGTTLLLLVEYGELFFCCSVIWKSVHWNFFQLQIALSTWVSAVSHTLSMQLTGPK